jgi:hypothetical protein
MALTKCKECSASIADSAERCPACGYVLTHPNTRNWFEILTSLSGPLVVSVAGTVLAYMTFVHQAETQKTQELQTMVESAVSNDPVKERTAVRLVSYLTKLDKLSPSFALSIFGTVARNAQDEKLRSEAYDAIENLLSEGSFKIVRFDKYDRLEIFCLRAALTPAQYWRQVNLHNIEKDSEESVLKYQAASKLLVLSQDVSNPQASIDLLLSLPILEQPGYHRTSDPDLMQGGQREVECRSRRGCCGLSEPYSPRAGPHRSRRITFSNKVISGPRACHQGPKDPRYFFGRNRSNCGVKNRSC